jgi:hypothetical protein
MKLRNVLLPVVVALCFAVAIPGAAAPVWQDEVTQPFRNRAWGLTFDYPASWDKSIDEPDAIAVGYADEEGGELRAFVVARSTAWTDWNYNVEDALREAIERVSPPAPNDLQMGEHLSRLVSGQKSHGASFTGADPTTGDEIAGYIYLFSQGRMGWAVVGLSTSAAWESTHRADCDAVLKSLVVGATGPTPTPTRKLTPTRRPSPTPTPTEATAEPDEVVFEDHFSGDGGYLGTYQAEDGHSEYADGVYKMVVTMDDAYIYGSTFNQQYGSMPKLAVPDTDLVGVSVDVDVTKVGGPDRSHFGVACGLQDGKTFYALDIGGDGGRFAISKAYDSLADVHGSDYFNTDFHYLAGRDWVPTPHPAINTGDGATNQLRGVCAKEGLALYVNDEKVAEQLLDGELSGGIGLFAYKVGEGPDLEVDFDNLVVRRLATQPDVVAGEAGEIAYEEDFSSETSGWYVGTFEDGTVTAGYHNGAYEISLEPGHTWQSYTPSMAYQDVSAAVDITQLSGEKGAFVGLYCRSLDKAGYEFSIDANGKYWIGMTTPEGEYQALVDGAATSAIKKGLKQTNTVRVDCVGDTLTLFVNGRKVKQIQDDTFTEGYVRFILGSTESSSAQFAFDNFVLRRP